MTLGCIQERREKIHDTVTNEFVRAISSLCDHYDKMNPTEELIGLGLICGDDVASFGPFVLFRSMIPKGSTPDYRFNPPD